MFYWVSNFSGNGVEKWNVSNVVNMAAMFSSCDSFNADLSNWDVSQVKNMTHAFSWTRRFRGDGLDCWNTTNLAHMNFIFCNALVVKSNLSGWYLSNVKDMSVLFNYATMFQGIGVEMWNTSRVETMVAMFCNASSFNANLSQWDVSKVKNADSMF
jgi:surface protein